LMSRINATSGTATARKGTEQIRGMILETPTCADAAVVRMVT
jgi:hypothetical protein